MPTIKKFNGFENKEDIFELIDKFDKSSLFELEVSIEYNKTQSETESEAEIKIKMMKLAGSDHDSYNENDEMIEKVEKLISMKKSSNDVEGDNEIPAKNKHDKSGKTINAPLIGTFYSSPSPESEPYVKVGDKIGKGDIVCIIEAMKIMNEIDSETDGEIAEILVNNGEVVEFGQPLFRIK